MHSREKIFLVGETRMSGSRVRLSTLWNNIVPIRRVQRGKVKKVLNRLWDSVRSSLKVQGRKKILIQNQLLLTHFRRNFRYFKPHSSSRNPKQKLILFIYNYLHWNQIYTFSIVIYLQCPILRPLSIWRLNFLLCHPF